MRLYFVPPLQALLAAIIIWLLGKYVPQWTIPFDGHWMLGMMFILTGALIDVASMSMFNQARTTVNPIDPTQTQSLVIQGTYRFSRNPMYLGMFLMLLGWSVMQASLPGLIVPFIFAAILTHLQIKPEERVLKEKFGSNYDDYCRKVRRWI